MVGAVVSAYLAVWTVRWTGGALPLHSLWLDAAVVLVCVGVAGHRRRRALVAPIVPILVHTAAQRGWISEPQGSLEWGIAATCAGFVSLLGAVWSTWHLGRRLRQAAESVDANGTDTVAERGAPSVAS